VNRSELVAAVADKAGVSQKDADAVLKAFADAIVDALAKKEKVSLPGFLTFDVGFREARTGRNPQTGEPVKIAASTRMKFTSSTTLKAALNPKKK
jgi:DNA-binding protein HU-beta